MDSKTFDLVLFGRIDKVRKLMASKSQEYARGDKLSNFKKAGGALGAPPEQALLGMWIKHVVSITDMIQDIDKGKVAPYELWEEKLTDIINYMILLDALLVERLSK